jgi:hypothetical protein
MVGLGRLPDESRDAVADGPDGFRGPTERVAAASWVASWGAVRVAAPAGTADAREVGEAEAACGTGETVAAGLCLHPARGIPRSSMQAKATIPDGIGLATSAAGLQAWLRLLIPGSG